MKFKPKYDFYKRTSHYRSYELVNAIIYASGYDTKGDIESLQRDLNTLADIVSWMAAKLSDADLIELADKHGFEPTLGGK
jgi:hypothetical protein